MHRTDGFSGFRSRIASPALQAIADHWQQACAHRPMPAWSDLLPAAIAAHLKRLWAFKYDRATGDFTARLAGTRAMARFGKSFRGTPLRELHPPHVFEQSHAFMTRVVSEPAFTRCTGKLFKIGDHAIEGERIGFHWPRTGFTGTAFWVHPISSISPVQALSS